MKQPRQPLSRISFYMFLHLLNHHPFQSRPKENRGVRIFIKSQSFIGRKKCTKEVGPQLRELRFYRSMNAEFRPQCLTHLRHLDFEEGTLQKSQRGES